MFGSAPRVGLRRHLWGRYVAFRTGFYAYYASICVSGDGLSSSLERSLQSVTPASMCPQAEVHTLSALQAFRARNINASNKNAALKSTMPQVDLSHYKSILKNASAVEAAEKALSSFKPVDYDVSKWDKVVDAFEQKAVSQAKETVQKVDKEETDLKATLSNITEARPFEDLTSDEAAAANPEISKATESPVCILCALLPEDENVQKMSVAEVIEWATSWGVELVPRIWLRA
ncbi:subunit d of the stator stalk of F1F0 ATP synthase required for ATP synthesis, Atp7p [Trichosporon asahii var. asahii CBS 2479]|uniref:ATP synthase subunit d, mitochondrial n=1 Tax=Trichosporon asahii var. asahii (strain ATCC 90039 / CBS 2479 / JCM 2466 / KCTC 7840 / NBRC 103889/ NCYC 2677 / UAMH 7654) TaxID=1186058 RepID=J4UGY3_TRIAS|nr:subunit d of the stator stalk of F1F0 ATP synthase required for ATP synthesis, Atp7p [Trichosporon asahii var. asahii CBS 2479]EJT50795.1 subunit d of the stator stalk of F1F0 ATP synthase required for ATP synthesis, Atp7p [Trichosporon asahii var. asahii CBS 2479]